MKHAFQKIGIEQRDVDFNIAIAKYINAGGTYSGAEALLAAAKRLDASHRAIVPDRNLTANVRIQPSEDVRDQGSHATTAHAPIVPPSSPDREPAAYPRVSEKTSNDLLPVREPSPAQRAASAVVARLSIMDTWKIDGRAVGDWTVSEARLAGKAKTRDGYILIESARHVANATGSERIRDIVKVAEMQRIIQKSAEVADAV